MKNIIIILSINILLYGCFPNGSGENTKTGQLKCCAYYVHENCDAPVKKLCTTGECPKIPGCKVMDWTVDECKSCYDSK